MPKFLSGVDYDLPSPVRFDSPVMVMPLVVYQLFLNLYDVAKQIQDPDLEKAISALETSPESKGG